MGRCNSEECNRKRCLTLKCKHCGGEFCTACIQFEVHHCPNMDRAIEIQRTHLAERLESERTVKKKLFV